MKYCGISITSKHFVFDSSWFELVKISEPIKYSIVSSIHILTNLVMSRNYTKTLDIL